MIRQVLTLALTASVTMQAHALKMKQGDPEYSRAIVIRDVKCAGANEGLLVFSDGGQDLGYPIASDACLEFEKAYRTQLPVIADILIEDRGTLLNLYTGKRVISIGFVQSIRGYNLL